jgi:hypothetical protein
MGQRWTPECKADEARRRAYWKDTVAVVANARGHTSPPDRETAKLYKADAIAVIGATERIIDEEIQCMFRSGELTSEELHGPEWLNVLEDENDAVLRRLQEAGRALER